MLFVQISLFSQVQNGYNEFKYDNGKISSEGFIENGKPNGYWKTYHENGNLKSEGNRVNYELDSLWRFFSVHGFVNLEISYQNGLKQGFRKFYNNDAILLKKEEFIRDTIQYVYEYFQSGQLQFEIPFEEGVKNGTGFEYDTLGLKISILKYKSGILKKSEINRTDKLGRKHGKWIDFDGKFIVRETNYSFNLKNGIEKIYNQEGKLISVFKYKNGILIKDFKKVKIFKVKKEFYSDGTIGKTGGYNNKGLPNGVHREYNSDGKVISSKLYNNGTLEGEGIVQKNGLRDGKWSTYYKTGEILSKGNYSKGIKIGNWKFFYKNGHLEEEGNYNNKGEENGIWNLYYETGDTMRIVEYLDGLYDGKYIFYNDSGLVISSGIYKEGYEEGEWFYINGNNRQFGSYLNGEKIGEWRSYYNRKQIVFKGKYENGLPTGKHKFWYQNGALRRFGDYRIGRKNGDWYFYSKGGRLLMISTFKDGLQKTLNGFKINPEHDSDDYVEYEQTGY